MRRTFLACAIFAPLLLVACGGGAIPSRGTPVRQALTNLPELLEFESPQVRQDLFREVARASLSEAGQVAHPAVLFPISINGELRAAPGFDARTDLLQTPDAGTYHLTFDSPGERWSEDRRDVLQGLSEREVAELVARSLLSQWGIGPEGEIAVDRATGAPYAAAYVDGILRVNPSFLYLAASFAPSLAPSAQ